MTYGMDPDEMDRVHKQMQTFGAFVGRLGGVLMWLAPAALAFFAAGPRPS